MLTTGNGATHSATCYTMCKRGLAARGLRMLVAFCTSIAVEVKQNNLTKWKPRIELEKNDRFCIALIENMFYGVYLFCHST